MESLQVLQTFFYLLQKLIYAFILDLGILMFMGENIVKDFALELTSKTNMKLKLNKKYEITLYIPPCYTKVKAVSINKDGIIYFDSNLGLEVYDIKEMLKQKNKLNKWNEIKEQIDIYLKNNKTRKGDITNMKVNKNLVLVLEGFEVYINKNRDEKNLFVKDTVRKHEATLIIEKIQNGIIQISIKKSTFPESKRKYEMLYLLEKSKNELMEEY